jgi:hypothetical protein
MFKKVQDVTTAGACRAVDSRRMSPAESSSPLEPHFSVLVSLSTTRKNSWYIATTTTVMTETRVVQADPVVVSLQDLITGEGQS